MDATSGAGFCRWKVALVCMLLLFDSARPVRAGGPGDAATEDEKRQRRMMALSIRIAQSQGNEAKISKFKSLSRQQRARKNVRAPRLGSPGTRASRPARTP